MSTDEFVPEWDVSRDDEGTPIILTVDQVRAVWHAVRRALGPVGVLPPGARDHP